MKTALFVPSVFVSALLYAAMGYVASSDGHAQTAGSSSPEKAAESIEHGDQNALKPARNEKTRQKERSIKVSGMPRGKIKNPAVGHERLSSPSRPPSLTKIERPVSAESAAPPRGMSSARGSASGNLPPIRSLSRPNAATNRPAYHLPTSVRRGVGPSAIGGTASLPVRAAAATIDGTATPRKP